MVACFLWLGWRAAATFSSEAHTGVLAIQVAQVSYPERYRHVCVFFPLFLLSKLEWVKRCVCM